jgi:hypothetical protein
MVRNRRRKMIAAVGALAGATLFSTTNFACESFVGESLMTSANMCFIFDCNNGAFGGILRPCQLPGTVGQAEGVPGTFLDCPVVAP